MTCALLFFGAVKHFEKVLPTINQHILKCNDRCDVYAHTYNIDYITNPRNGEQNQRIFPTDILNLSKNIMLEVPSNVRVEDYRYLFPVHGKWSYPTSIDNMMLQWNSIERVFEMAMHVKNYVNIGFFRLDVLYRTDIRIDKHVAAVPAFHPFGGYNDRMFYGLATHARTWATRFPYIKEYTRNRTGGIRSEAYLRFLLSRAHVPVTRDRTVCFHRIRATAHVSKDC